MHFQKTCGRIFIEQTVLVDDLAANCSAAKNAGVNKKNFRHKIKDTKRIFKALKIYFVQKAGLMFEFWRKDCYNRRTRRTKSKFNFGGVNELLKKDFSALSLV